MKRIINKVKENILIYTIIVVIFFIIIHFLLETFNIRFRVWVYCFIAIYTMAGVIIGVLQLFIMKKNKIVKLAGAIMLVAIISLFPVAYVLLGFAYRPEHVINKNGKKYIACVESFLKVDVYYYDYINIIFRGKQKRIHEYYGSGGYDPFNSKQPPEPKMYCYYDNDGKIIENNDEVYNRELINNTQIIVTAGNVIMDFYNFEKNETQNELPEIYEDSYVKAGDTLYEKKINSKKSIRVVNHGAILAQRSVIRIEKTNDGGKTWNNQLETTDGYMQIHDGAKFIFINENIGFINDPGLVGTNGENRGLLVTTDGGKNFRDCIIVSDRIEDNLYIDDVPYMENNKLKLKAYTIENYDKKYYYFYSEDNGINWKQIQ